ncbi:hypothetical protein TrLO_g14331 [Triparma laevis f. longispina]|uniref:Uncharacterized protein n=1 Tax=Triparma laevis f. longispina TaxID=1714387 RepID=A0A9W6ZNF3_9STRA|nr:hypothetical protein TrLO_g14331 [Triparma laevis f. longispina]
MGGWFSSSCSYESGWNKNNACPPGFETIEDCGWWSSTISCRLTKTPSSQAVPVSARYNIDNEICSTGVNKNISPDDGGPVPPNAPPCGGNDVEIATRYTACCSNVFGGCNVDGWMQTRTCAEGQGDLVFDVWGPKGCADKSSGLSNNFQAQQWCKDEGSGSGHCWIPYSMSSDTTCFPLDKDLSGQWTSISSDGWSATNNFGGTRQSLPGSETPADLFKNAWEESAVREMKVGNVGAVAGVGGLGAAAVVGIFNRRRKLRVVKKGGVGGEGGNAIQMV